MIRPMGRTLWFVAGAGAGVYAVNRARRAAEMFTPEGLADRMAGWSLGAHLFGQEVRAGMAEKETELRRRMGLMPHGQTPGGGLEQGENPRRELDQPQQIGKGND